MRHKGVIFIELSERQEEILSIVNKSQPITGEDIASDLGTSRSTLRTDLEVLTKLGFLEAKPRVGYIIKNGQNVHYKDKKVSDVMSVAVVINERASLHDAVVSIFLNDVGSLFVSGEKGLIGIISRKDIVTAMLGGKDINTIPVNMIMTRMPNVVTVEAGSFVSEAVYKLIHHEIDSLPVVEHKDGNINIVGRFTKTNSTKLFYEIINPQRGEIR